MDAHSEPTGGDNVHRQICLAPLGLLRLRAAVRQNRPDIDAEIYDWGIQSRGSGGEQRFLSRLRDYRPAVVGISALTVGMPLALRIAALVRSHDPGIPLVLGGSHATALPLGIGRYEQFDYYVRGNAARVGPLLFGALLDGNPAIETVPSLAFRRDGHVVTTPLEAAPKSLDHEPRIRWDDISVDHYDQNESPSAWFPPRVRVRIPDGGAFTYLASQGCPHNCRFCERSCRTPIRRHSPDRIVADLRASAERLGMRHVFLADNNPNSDRAWFSEVLRRVSSELDLRIACMVRADTLDDDLIDRMADCGVFTVGCAPESGSERVLADMGKRLDLDRLLRHMRRASDHGMLVTAGFIFGWPGETLEEAERTLELAEEPCFDFVAGNALIYFGGADIGSEIVRAGIELDSPEHHRHVATPASVCLADYAPDEFRGILERIEELAVSKAREVERVEKARRLGLELWVADDEEEQGADRPSLEVISGAVGVPEAMEPGANGLGVRFFLSAPGREGAWDFDILPRRSTGSAPDVVGETAILHRPCPDDRRFEAFRTLLRVVAREVGAPPDAGNLGRWKRGVLERLGRSRAAGALDVSFQPRGPGFGQAAGPPLTSWEEPGSAEDADEEARGDRRADDAGHVGPHGVH